MKSLFLLIIIFSVSVSLYSQDTLVFFYDHNWKEISDKNTASFYRKAFKTADKRFIAHDYYIDGNIQMTGVYKDKKYKEKHGLFTYYFANGTISSKGECINDKNAGLWTLWHENGQKESEGLYKNGFLDGRWQYWYDNGLPRYTITHKLNIVEGEGVYWHDTGEKKAQGNFLNGTKDGAWKYYYKNGDVSGEEFFQNGKLISATEYYNDNIVKSKGSYVDGKNSGVWTFWDTDGRVIWEGSYINGIREGEWNRFFKNGEKMKVLFEKGVLIGKNLGGIIIVE